ncbi:unnamed protein product [Oppiella nova]|uniref:RBR-type E3 ubiquitin transferase n=1 Tax=Oppiella nova TaxID=334625 RepID=A0A7R9QRE1_9ACAR|nr:unnamed protein product [Oppiella nova]CAG2171112.1 unnamed protein product [Oppiella nova]
MRFAQEFEYEVLTIDEIQKQIHGCIEEIKAVIQLSSATIRTLLAHFKWDTQKLLERLFDGNQEQLFADIGIVSNRTERTTPNGNESKRQCYAKSVCFICYSDDIKPHHLLRSPLLHSLLDAILDHKIMSEGDVMAITCPATDCKVVVDEEQVLQLITDETVRAKYQRLNTDSYVSSNRLLRWCPRPDCLHAFSAQTKEAHPVVCVCGKQICFGCGEDNHEPIGCQLLREWNVKSAGSNGEMIDG